MSDRSDEPLLDVRKATKRFPGVLALDHVDMTLHRGEVLAVIGENGAGKSTLMKILAGVQAPDSGQILLDGNLVQIDSVQRALGWGISLIHQELNLSDNLDVGANIFLGREPLKFGLIDTTRIRRESCKYLDMVGLKVKPHTIASTLSIGQQQLVEIAKALSTNARILIMDEPTSSLTQHEAERLFGVIKHLRSRGVSIVYISHRLGEVKKLADRVLVLRDGKNAGQLMRDEIDHDAMVKLMVGRDVTKFYARQMHEAREPLLEVRQLCTPAHPRHSLSFSVCRGEIVGVAGLVGAGRTQLLRVLFGIDRAVGGAIQVDGSPVDFRSSVDAIRAGIALVPEDRKQQGLIIEMTLRHNLSLAGLRQNRHAAGFLNFSKEMHDTLELIEMLKIKAPGVDQIVQYLSGGNQQKVVLAKWLSLRPRILLLDEPTRGIDVGAKQEIYALMEELAEQGVAILFASSEMEEIIGMSDRTLVMHEGRITGELTHDQLSEETIMQCMTGRISAA